MPWHMEVFDEDEDSKFYLKEDQNLGRLLDDPFQRVFDHGHAVPPEHQPFRFVQRTARADYPDLFQGRFFGNMIMSARMRAVVEGLAPASAGLQFVPVVIERSDGRPGPEGCSFFKVVDLVDAIVPERSEVAPQCSDGKLYRYSAWIGAKIAFRPEVVGGRHVWVDKYLNDRVFISDELRAAMMAAELTGVSTSQVDPN